MLKNLTQVYCLIICLVASIVMMVTIGIMLISATDLIFTNYKYKNQLNRFVSNEKYIDYQKHTNPNNKEKWESLSMKLVEEKRIAAKREYIEELKDSAISGIINCATWLITGLIFFVIHWKMYRRSSSNIHN
jgi:hypothetical protein